MPVRWRLHGDVPSFDQFLAILYTDVRATFVLERSSDGSCFGVCQLWSLTR